MAAPRFQSRPSWLQRLGAFHSSLLPFCLNCIWILHLESSHAWWAEILLSVPELDQSPQFLGSGSRNSFLSSHMSPSCCEETAMLCCPSGRQENIKPQPVSPMSTRWFCFPHGSNTQYSLLHMLTFQIFEKSYLSHSDLLFPKLNIPVPLTIPHTAIPYDHRGIISMCRLILQDLHQMRNWPSMKRNHFPLLSLSDPLDFM